MTRRRAGRRRKKGKTPLLCRLEQSPTMTRMTPARIKEKNNRSPVTVDKKKNKKYTATATVNRAGSRISIWETITRKKHDYSAVTTPRRYCLQPP